MTLILLFLIWWHGKYSERKRGIVDSLSRMLKCGTSNIHIRTHQSKSVRSFEPQQILDVHAKDNQKYTHPVIHDHLVGVPFSKKLEVTINRPRGIGASLRVSLSERQREKTKGEERERVDVLASVNSLLLLMLKYTTSKWHNMWNMLRVIV